MKRENLKNYIRTNAQNLLTPDKKKKGYICPICGSGSGTNGTGITTKDGIHFTCWAGCYTNSDIIDIIGKKYNLSDFNSKLQATCNEFHISAYEDNNFPEKKQIAKKTDYTDFFLQAEKNIGKTDYHRGLTESTLKKYRIGYMQNWTNPNAPYSPPSPRIIIPTGPYSYLARDTRTNLTENQKKFSKIKVGKVRIYNSDILLKAKKPIFIVEGEIDALSIIDAGGEAVALGSTANINLFLDIIRQNKPQKPLIIAMDNDKAGKRASETFINSLKSLCVEFYVQNWNIPYKDANDVLQANREDLKTIVDYYNNIQTEFLKQNSAYCSLQNFMEYVKSNNNNYIPTGFSQIDKILDGGLYSGLYIIGAISSLGKTTFCLQVADQIAETGKDIIIFSMEMDKNELIAKSISRQTRILDNSEKAKSTREILCGIKYKNYNDEEIGLINNSIRKYKDIARNIFIFEGNANSDITQIRNTIKNHIEITGRNPLVLIDYIQLIKSDSNSFSDKQNTDKTVLELKRISRDYNIPIIGISSFNRENYSAPVNLASFKESGAIEYSSDVLIGLQYAGMDYIENETEKNREKRIRTLIKNNSQKTRNGGGEDIEVKILKNRNGTKGSCILDFYPKYNYFTEKEIDREELIKNISQWQTSVSNYK